MQESCDCLLMIKKNLITISNILSGVIPLLMMLIYFHSLSVKKIKFIVCFFMVIILFIFSAIALTSDGCITTQPGYCTSETCEKWCHDTYQGHGYCVRAVKRFSPNFFCLCSHTIKCPI